MKDFWMKMSTVCNLLSSFLLLAFAGVDATITEFPSNAVAEIGNDVTFNCTTDNSPPSWYLTTDGTSTDIQYIAAGCVVEPQFIDQYRVEQPDGDIAICNLIAVGVTSDQAGVYTCTENGPTASALLTVVDPEISVTVHNQSEIYDGQQLAITCFVQFFTSALPAPTLRPSIAWTTSPEQIFTTSEDDESPNAITSIAMVTVQKPIVPIFTCNVNFVLSPSSPPDGYAANNPDDTYQINTSIVYDVSAEPTTGCGSILRDAPPPYLPTSNWDNMCYITSNDTAYIDTPCFNLIIGLPLYNDGNTLIQAGGNYGCYVTADLSNGYYLNACTDNYQQTLSLGNCINCNILAVCIRFP